MSASPTDLRLIIGRRPWRVWKGYGSFLLFEFGRPHMHRGKRYGTYSLWIYLAEWSIKKAGHEVAHSESPDQEIHDAADAITGKKLESASLVTFVTKRRKRHGASFHFVDEFDLHVRAYQDGDDDDRILMLHTPAECISYLRDGTWSSEPRVR